MIGKETRYTLLIPDVKWFHICHVETLIFQKLSADWFNNWYLKLEKHLAGVFLSLDCFLIR